MLTERIWSGNSLRNFHYLIACPETGEALAVDPLEWQLCLDAAPARGWQITQILNTHEHEDHTGGNAALKAATGAKVLAHAGAASRIGGVDRGLNKGDIIKVGRTVELECLDTPGHTMTHVCLLSHTEEPALFCGDTLFNAGAGNCHNGGDPQTLYDTFVAQLARLPTARASTRATSTWRATSSSRSTASRPTRSAASCSAAARGHEPATAPVTTLAQEKRVNTFLRLQSPEVIARLREKFPDMRRAARPARPCS